MIWHPLLLAVLILDALATIFLLHAAVTYLRVLLGWDPEAIDARQVALEGATEGASLATRYGIGLSIAATLLLLVGVSLVLPGTVNGAMCGTGVLTATGPIGSHALLLRGAALAVLWVWRTVDGINRSVPRPPEVPLVGRWQLLALPLSILATLYTVRAMLQLDPYQPVDCCQVIYSSFRDVAEATTAYGLADSTWVWIGGGGTALLIALSGAALWRLRRDHTSRLALPSLLVALGWLPVAGLILTRVFAAYQYEVLHHHCPWCLLLPEHRGVGYPLFGALVLVGLEALAFEAADALGRKTASLQQLCRRRQRRALKLMLAAVVLFVGLSVGPALRWRLTYGVWMHNS